MLFRLLMWLGCIPWLVHSLALVDEISDADPPQSGYLPNHNMQPPIVGSSSFAYFFAKGYRNNAASGGVANGIYNFHAVNILDLTDRPGFPVLVDGNNADNDPTRYFVGGAILQRPLVTLIGSTVYGAFGGHCDLFNYTRIIAGVSIEPDVEVNSMSMEAAPGGPPVTLDITEQKGGTADICMAPATDGRRLFVTTGNEPYEYFDPYECIGMDAGDRDLGSGDVALLDPSVYRGTNGVTRITVTIGKNGKAYIMNADNSGGFKLGPGATDNVLWTIISPNAVLGGAGSYRLEGGYIYLTHVGEPTLAYKLGLDQKDAPLFSKVEQSPDNSAGRVDVGVPTVTTYKGQPGTGIFWVTDV
ncbi:MAG: hypothetical protein Q9209_004475 [Squamulea sp. 1 TL-2023]